MTHFAGCASMMLAGLSSVGGGAEGTARASKGASASPFM